MINGRGVNEGNNNLELGGLSKQSKSRKEKPSVIETPEAREVRLQEASQVKIAKVAKKARLKAAKQQAQSADVKHNGADEKHNLPRINPVRIMPSIQGHRQEGALANVLTNNPFIAALAKEATPPKPLAFKMTHICAAIFGIACTATLAKFYIAGAKEDGLGYQIGGSVLNAIQNLFYGIGAFFFLTAASKPYNRGNVGAGLVLAICATAANVLSSLKFARKEEDSSIPYLTGVGTFFMSLYGMTETIKRLRNFRSRPNGTCFINKEDSELRKAVIGEIRDSYKDIKDQAIQASIAGEKIRHWILRAAVMTIAMSLGLTLATGMFGYIFSSGVEAAAIYGGLPMGITAAFFGNMPSILIALLLTGYDLANSMVYKVTDALTDGINMTPRAVKFAAALVIAVGVFYKLSDKSDATARHLADGAPIDGFGLITDFVRFSMSEGTKKFNLIMTSLVAYLTLDYFNKAYDPSPENRTATHVSSMIDFAKNAPIGAVKGLASKFGGMFANHNVQTSVQTTNRDGNVYIQIPEAQRGDAKETNSPRATAPALSAQDDESTQNSAPHKFLRGSNAPTSKLGLLGTDNQSVQLPLPSAPSKPLHVRRGSA